MPRRSLETQSGSEGGHCQRVFSRRSDQGALAAGAKGFVNKPFDMRQVLEVIRAVLDEEQRPAD